MKIEELLEAATPRPWIKRSNGAVDCFVMGNEAAGRTRAGPYMREILSDENYEKKHVDADLIAGLDYIDPDTDTMWLGFAIGMRAAERIAAAMPNNAKTE